MTITATRDGRNLVLRTAATEGAEALEPFIVRPLPSLAGIQITDTYLRTATGQSDGFETAAALVMALDGATEDPKSRQWVPAVETPNSARMEVELSIGETEDVAMAAFFWQTILGWGGVETYLSAGGGVTGHLAGMQSLVARLSITPHMMAAGTVPVTSTTPSPSASPVKRLVNRLVGRHV